METFDLIGLLGFSLSLALAVWEFVMSRPRVDIHAPRVYIFRRAEHSDVSLIADMTLVSRSSRPVSVMSILINDIDCVSDARMHYKVIFSSSDAEDETRSLRTAGMPQTLQPFEARRIRVAFHLPQPTLEKSLVESRSWHYTRHPFFSEVELPPSGIPSIALFDLALRTNCSAIFARRKRKRQECQVRSLRVLLDDMLRDP